MKDFFLKYPSTPHLFTLDGIAIRGDKVMSQFESDEFLSHKITVEEKVDGANAGFSFDSDGNIHVQNRGEYLNLPSTGQWKKLDEWLVPRIDELFESLTNRYILFGEWCYARHSVFYNHLPDWFLGFDVYDKQTGRFLSCARRDLFFLKIRITKVPTIAFGKFTLSDLNKFLSQSVFSDQPVEGLYLRYDHGEWLKQRAKLVRPEFIQSVEQHWSRSVMMRNKLSLESHR